MINTSLSKKLQFVFTVFANYSYVIINFLLIVIISERFSTEILGSYLHAFVIINLLSIILKFGNENYLLRTGSFKKDSLNQAKTTFLTLCLPIVVVVVILAFLKYSFLFYFIPYLLGFTFLTLIIAYNKGRDVNKSFWLNLLIFSVIPLINICVIYFCKPSIQNIILLLGFLYFLLALYFFFKKLKISIYLILDRSYLKECSQYLILTVGAIMAASSSSLIIGFLLDSQLTASYIILEKITDIILLSVTVIAVLSSKPLVHSFNNQSNFKKSYHSFLFKSLILATIVTILTASFLNEILNFMNFDYFENYTEVLYILFIGKFLICCFGPAILITSISNQRVELIYAYIFIIFFNIIFGSLLISFFGATGAAVNSVTTLITLRLVFFNKIKNKYFL